MKKATMFTIYLGCYIVVLFSICIGFTFINEFLLESGFFGDTLFKPYDTSFGRITSDGAIDKEHVWGARHYWYFVMCCLLFVISCIRIIIWGFIYWDEKSCENTKATK